MPDRSIDHLAKITAKPAPRETGPEAKKIKAAEKAVAMGQVTDPEEISPRICRHRRPAGSVPA
jgi:hypothetical protein